MGDSVLRLYFNSSPAPKLNGHHRCVISLNSWYGNTPILFFKNILALWPFALPHEFILFNLISMVCHWGRCGENWYFYCREASLPRTWYDSVSNWSINASHYFCNTLQKGLISLSVGRIPRYPVILRTLILQPFELLNRDDALTVEKLRTVLYFPFRISFICLSIFVYLLFFVGWKFILHWSHSLVQCLEQK